METNNVKLLVVDDNVQNLMTVSAILGSEGYTIVTTRSGNEALRHLLDTEFAVILVDVVMPGMDGFEFVRAVRSREKTARVPIIFTSGFQIDETDVTIGYDLGAIDYITLPLVPHILKAKVAVLVALYLREKELIIQQEKLRKLEKTQFEQRMALLMKEREKEREQRDAMVLQARAQALEKSNRELNRFSTIVAHDLQEPLRTVSLYLSLLTEELKGKLSPKSKEYLDLVLESSKRMSNLITDLLKYSQVDYAAQKKTEPVAFDSVVQQAKENLAATIELRQAKVIFSDLPMVLGDPAQLTQMIQNLIGNSIKFCPNRTPEIEIKVVAEDEMIKFSLKDNGIGIAPRHFGKVFSAFERLHDKSKYPGTGVGLAICKKIVEHHGGKIWLESEEGVGTTFFFTLPKAKTEQPLVPAQAPLTGMRLLIVDDDKDIAQLLRTYLANLGAEVQMTNSGKDCLRVVQESNFHTIVLDIQMPEMDGFETLKKLREMECGIPAVAYTSIEVHTRDKDFKEAGFAKVVSKNGGPSRLVDYLKSSYSPTETGFLLM